MTEYHGLTENAVWNQLRQLAETPFDLTQTGALSRQRLFALRSEMAGFRLLYATERVDDTTLDALQRLANESGVVSQFLAMKKGAVLNRIDGYDSENRMVLHTAVRDIFSDQPFCPEATAQAKSELAKLAAFLDQLASGMMLNEQGQRFTDMVLVGIGGSDLGPRALYLALQRFSLAGRKVHFISNVDPDDAAMVLQGLDLSRTLVNVVSKSGTTLETLTNETLVRAAFVKAGLNPQLHFLAVTGKGSPMDNPERYRESFYMFDYIGGRYSVTSMVGAVVLGFALGYAAVIEILRGANAVDLAAENPDIRQNIPLLLALLGVWNRNLLGHETLAILPYSQALLRFTAHLQQCDMESNGKSIDRSGRPLAAQSGPIVWGEPGTNGQHAFYQLIHQGSTVVPVEFIGFLESQFGEDQEIEGTTSQEKLLANLLAQSLALATGREHNNPNRRFGGNRPNCLLIGSRLNPFAMGALLAIYEAKIAFQGFIWNLNSFDQEGVQLGKVLANQLLDHLQEYRQSGARKGGEADESSWAMLEAAGVLGYSA
ncbi:MAG: glucose-6-phosphate isomerase [Desulfobulbaceae bacterium]|nr:glucose-6-phosphate isomerase [Desulfobulbaceae bacterium]